MPSNTKKYDKEGLVRVEIDMDFKTYAILLALVKKSGYKIGPDYRQKSEGIRGVLTQGTLELYQKYVEENEVEEEGVQHNGLNKINQQAYIFANHARAMKINGIPDEKIVSTLQSKLPSYLKDHKKGKLLAEKTMKKFVAASTFSTIELPELKPGMKEDLKRKKVYKYIKLPTKKS